MAEAAPNWSIASREHGRLVVTLCGDLDVAGADALAVELRRRLESASPGSHEVYYDLDGLTRCSVDARSALLRIQRFLAGVARRTAYVANRPLFRGVGLWICHQAPDANARTFAAAAHAHAWLAESTRRDVDLAARAARWFARVERKEAHA